MGTELPPGSYVSVDFRILGVGDEVGASKPLEDDGWGPSVGVGVPSSQGTSAGVRSLDGSWGAQGFAWGLSEVQS